MFHFYLLPSVHQCKVKLVSCSEYDMTLNDRLMEVKINLIFTFFQLANEKLKNIETKEELPKNQ